MRVIADLHIHSHYSRATSPKLTLPYLDRWARIKGIGLVGTGDCTHPGWLAELAEQLEPAGDGFFRVKPALRREFDEGRALAEDLPVPPLGSEVRFVLTGEISTIYSRDGKTRKVHHVVILPDFAAAAAFQARLERMGNITSDGRPILGVDSRDLFAALLDADECSILVPAHIWTPWFSALGARSGFDSIEECYGDLTSQIGAVETGLSSNPPMNWAVSALDRFSIISNSDAHSPEKLGREATVFDMEDSFAGLARALAGGGDSHGSGGDSRKAAGAAETIEFFPQEGKYHYDGHRACGVVLSPEESAACGGRCPVCGKPLTPGVMRRVAELADRPIDETAPCPQEYGGSNRRPYRSLIPLPELLAEILGTGSGSKKVAAAYRSLIDRAGSEFSLLLDCGERELESMGTAGVSGELLAMAIGRMRLGRVFIKPGYDGEYGVIHAFAPGEHIEPKAAGAGLFDGEAEEPETTIDVAPRAHPAPKETGPVGPTVTQSPVGPGRPAVPWRPSASRGAEKPPAAASNAAELPPPRSAFRLDPAQEVAVNHPGGPALIVAGPGTGKTAVLALRIARLVEKGLDPSSILAVTFTNKAANELRDRIAGTIGPDRAVRLTAATFHSFCLALLREHADEASLPRDFTVLDEEERDSFLKATCGSGQEARRLGSYIEARKRFLLRPGDPEPRLGPGAPEGLVGLAAELGIPPVDPRREQVYADYRDALKKAHALDFDDLVAGAARLLSARPATLSAYRERFRAVFVDEYQDVNFAQYALIRLLVPEACGATRVPGVPGLRDAPAELCVIGDPNQAIYGFRGSDRRFIGRFLEDYPDAAVYRLQRSFRCAPGIIGAAGRLVGTELEGSGASVALSRCEYSTEASEAEGIAREIDRLIGGTRFFALDTGVALDGGPGEGQGTGAHADTAADSLADTAPGTAVGAKEGANTGVAPTLSSLGECAILVRAAALAPPIEKALLDHGIPYRFIGDTPWWKEESVHPVIGLLRAAMHPGPAVRAEGHDFAATGTPKGNEARPGRPPAIASSAEGSPDKSGGSEKLTEALRARLSATTPPVEAVRAAIGLLCGDTPHGASRAADGLPGKEALPEIPGADTVSGAPLRRLLSQASLYPDIASFLDDLALGSPQDGLDARAECVSLMTIHAAKGLEFDYVFVTGLEEGLLPFTLFERQGAVGVADEALQSQERLEERIEEERRLLYVAMTRARIGLYLSWARSRHFMGRKLSLPPSRFLAQVEDLVPLVERSSPKPKRQQLNLF